MLHSHVVALATLALCVAEEGSKGGREARNPALLHLAHAGHSVGSYLGPQGAHGGGGPQILIYGGHPQVTTRVVSKDSLEELDEDIRQHYQQQPIRYVPNSSFRQHYFGEGRQNEEYPSYKDTSVSPLGNKYSPVTGAPALAFSYPRTYGHFGASPILFNPQAHSPLGQGFAGVSTFVGHPAQSHSPAPQHRPTSSPSHYSQAQNTPTPSTASYATPTPHSYPVTPTANPLAHTLSSPVLLPARVPLHHPFQGGVGGVAPVAPLLHPGLRYPLSQGPVFLPIQAFGPHLDFYRNRGHPQYHPQVEEGRSHKDDSSEDDQRGFYGGSQGRRPIEHQGPQREFEDDHSSEYSGENANYQKSYGYESDEIPKSAATPAHQTYPSEDKGSYEAPSNEAGSAEKGGFKFGFADDHTKSRSSPLADGGGNVATSYQSVTFQTHHPVPLHYPKKTH